METTNLRMLLGDGRQSSAFVSGGAADVQVDAQGVHQKLNAIHRALVAHDAINQMLALEGIQPCPKLLEAIEKARSLEVITSREERLLKYFNQEANKAKHDF